MASLEPGLFVVICVAVFRVISSQNGDSPVFPPYFFVCSYHGGNSDQPTLETKEVTVNVAIDGNPSYYVPGQKYTGNF